MKRRTDNEKFSNKKKAIIAGIVAGVSAVVIAFSIYMDYSANKEVLPVDTGTTSIEQIVEDTNPDINDVLPDCNIRLQK